MSHASDASDECRQSWPNWSHRWWFGEEPAPGSKVTPPEEIVSTFHQHLVDKYYEAQSAVGDSELASQFWESMHLAEPYQPPSAGEALRIVLMGRTLAGKSTLLAALCGSHAERIGDGRQRFSRDVLSAPISSLPEVELVDTPGVGAHDGAVDYEAAMKEAKTADLVLWVASNDSFQEETAKSLRSLAVLGKPILVALNCRKALSDDFSRDDFLDDPGAVFAQQQGNFNRIRAHLNKCGVQPIAEVAIHAAAAFYALTDTERGPQLANASRISEILTTIADESVRHRDQRRVLRLVDGVRDQAANLALVLEQGSRTITNGAKCQRAAAGDLLSRQRHEIARSKEALESSVIASITRRREWHLTVTDFGTSLEQQWKGEVQALQYEIKSAIDSEYVALQTRLRRVGEAVTSEWTRPPPGDWSLGPLPDFKSVKWNRLVRAGVGLAAVGIVAALGLGGGLAVIAAPFAVKLLAPEREQLINLVNRIFKKRAQVLAERRDALRAKIGSLLDEWWGNVQQALTDQFVTIQGNFDATHDDACRLCDDADRAANCWSRASGALRERIDSIDTTTTACLLRLQGRHRLTQGLLRASRNPGVCIVATMAPQAAEDAWLFPLDSPEPVACAPQMSRADTSAQELPLVLGLTGSLARFASWSAQASTVVIPTATAAGVRGAWSDLLTHHAGKPIHIVGCPTAEQEPR